MLIAVLGTSLVFAITLVLTGMSNGFEVEAQRLVDGLNADTWAVRSGAAGPFLGQMPFPQLMHPSTVSSVSPGQFPAIGSGKPGSTESFLMS